MGIDFQCSAALGTDTDRFILVLIEPIRIIHNAAPSFVEFFIRFHPHPDKFPGIPVRHDVIAGSFDDLGDLVGLAKLAVIIARFRDIAVVHAGHGQNNTRIYIGKRPLLWNTPLPARQYQVLGRLVKSAYPWAEKMHIGQWIRKVIVLARGIDNNIRLEFI